MKNNIAVASYARKSCNTTFNGVTTVNTQNEVGIVVFDRNLKKIGEYPLADGSRAHLIKSAKYGANVLLAIGTSTSTGNPFLPASINAATDTMQFLLVSPSGAVITPATSVTPFSLSPADDWKVFSDGTVAWTYVAPDGFLRLYRLPVPAV